MGKYKIIGIILVVFLLITGAYLIGKKTSTPNYDDIISKYISRSEDNQATNKTEAVTEPTPTTKTSTNKINPSIQPKPSITTTPTDDASCLAVAKQAAIDEEAEKRGTFGYSVIKAHYNGSCHYEFSYSSRDSVGPVTLKVIRFYPNNQFLVSCTYSATKATECHGGKGVISEALFISYETSLFTN